MGAAADFRCATSASPPPRPSGRHVRLQRRSPPNPSTALLPGAPMRDNLQLASLFSRHQSFPTNRQRGAASQQPRLNFIALCKNCTPTSSKRVCSSSADICKRMWSLNQYKHVILLQDKFRASSYQTATILFTSIAGNLKLNLELHMEEWDAPASP